MWGRGASFEKAELGSWCIFNRIRTHELEAEHSQPASLNSRLQEGQLSSEGRLGSFQGSRGWRRDSGRPFLSDTLSGGLGASICPTPGAINTPSLSIGPSEALSLFDLAQAGPPTARQSSGGKPGSAHSVGGWAQPASEVCSDVTSRLGVWVAGGGKGVG